MDPGESTAECCAREVLEETGLVVRVGKLIGVYTSPHHITEYVDGNRVQLVGLSFEAEPIGGELGLSDETTEVGYFSQEQMKSMDVMGPIYELVADAFADQEAAFVR
jgi:8-oxo-dGTP pyrophosphatase MutT (NUDIX family)